MPKEPLTEEQLSFSFLLPWSDKRILTTREVAQALAMSDNAVRELVESRELEAHRYTIYGGPEARLSNRITTRSVLSWFAKTADYAPGAIVDALVEIAKTLTPSMLAVLIQKLQQLRK